MASSSSRNRNRNRNRSHQPNPNHPNANPSNPSNPNPPPPPPPPPAAAPAGEVERREVERWLWEDPTAKSAEEQEAKNAEDLVTLFDRIGPMGGGGMRTSIEEFANEKKAEGRELKEIYLAIDRDPEMTFTVSPTELVTESELSAGRTRMARQHVERGRPPATAEHVASFAHLFQGLRPGARRTGIDGTLHRISKTVHALQKEGGGGGGGGPAFERAPKMVAVTARVGRTIQGTVVPMIPRCLDGFVSSGSTDGSTEPVKLHVAKSVAEWCEGGVVFIGPPSVGKTTVLREMSRVLSGGCNRVVVVVDKSMEIAGTGVRPHEAIGHARVMQVLSEEQQHETMLEAVENQSPDVVVVDELSTREQAAAARTIAGRGVAVVATVHGESLAQLLQDPDRSLLVGGAASVTLSGAESAKRRDGRKQVLKRLAHPVFGKAVEVRGFSDWVVHENVAAAVDAILEGQPLQASWHSKRRARTARENGGGAAARGSMTAAAAAAAEDLAEGDWGCSIPVVGVPNESGSLAFAYAHLPAGQPLSAAAALVAEGAAGGSGSGGASGGGGGGGGGEQSVLISNSSPPIFAARHLGF
jgi:hypothetical protein